MITATLKTLSNICDCLIEALDNMGDIGYSGEEEVDIALSTLEEAINIFLDTVHDKTVI